MSSLQHETPRGVIGLRAALILYAVLIGASIATLKGPALVIALLIVGALAAKSIVYYFRSRIG
jgi:hypothetical protein